MRRREVVIAAAAVGGVGSTFWGLGVLSPPVDEDPERTSDRTDPPDRRPTSTPRAEPATGDPTPSAVEVRDVGRLVHAEVDRVREAHDRNALRWSPALATMAREWAAEMRRRGELVRRPGSVPDVAAEYGASCERGAETVARARYGGRVDGGGDVDTPRYDDPETLASGLVEQWTTAPEDRERLLSLFYSQVGVGVEITDDGEVWAVQNLC